MSASIVHVRLTDDGQWAIDFNGQQTAFASRGAAIAEGVHRAQQKDALLMISECESEAGASHDLTALATA